MDATELHAYVTIRAVLSDMIIIKVYSAVGNKYYHLIYLSIAMMC